MKCVIQEDGTILIGDIIHTNSKNYNHGYGSLMMEQLISYATEHGYSLICGNLSTVDSDHKERIHHFYEKFGFVITEHSEPLNCYYGEINKKLTEVNL